MTATEPTGFARMIETAFELGSEYERARTTDEAASISARFNTLLEIAHRLDALRDRYAPPHVRAGGDGR